MDARRGLPHRARALSIACLVAAATGPLEAQMSCAEAGYLCAAPANQPLMRWPDGQRVLRILVPAPMHETPSRALRYQQAAARGIMSWDRIPFELQVFEQAGNLRMDIVVEWETRLPASRIGETHVASGMGPNGAVFEVVRFVLATRIPEVEEQEVTEGATESEEPPEGEDSLPETPTVDPRDPNAPPDALTLATIEVTAAHELGHALGLPHSDSPMDVMYPETTGASLSRRDIESVRALYALPAGSRPRP